MAFALALCQPNRELAIARSLTRHHFPNHVFKIRNRCVVRGRVLDRLRPAFPRYVFLDPRNAFHALRTRFGIFDFVRGDGGHIAEVPDLALTSLRKIADVDDVIPAPERQSGRFRFGDRVIVHSSDDHRIVGQRAIFQYMVDEYRALVSLEWLSASVPCQVDERQLVFESQAMRNTPGRKRRRRRRRGRHEIQ
jgi:hypothetical protein